MSDKYRVLIQFDPGRGAYVARAPELSECAAEGDTRAEAFAQLEEELEAQVEQELQEWPPDDMADTALDDDNAPPSAGIQ